MQHNNFLRSLWKVILSSFIVSVFVFNAYSVFAAAAYTPGSRVSVSSGPLNVRATPALTGTLIDTQPGGSMGAIMSGPISSGGYNWWQVDFDTGVDGWVVENYLTVSITGSLSRTINTYQFSPNSPDPSGVVYLPSSQEFVIADSEVDELSFYKTGQTNIFRVSSGGTLLSTSTTMCFSHEPTGLAYNPHNGHYFVSDDDLHKVFERDIGSDKRFCTPDDIVFGTLSGFPGKGDIEGVAYDEVHNVLYLGAGNDHVVYKIDPGSDGLFDGVGDTRTSFDTLGFDMNSVEGIDYNAKDDTLYIVGSFLSYSRQLLQTKTDGTLLRSISIAVTKAKSPSGVALAPASNGSSVLNAYIVDRGIDSSKDPNQNDGKFHEISLTDTVAPTVTLTAPTAGATVSGTTAVSANASDNFGVSGVQFKVDGVNLGAEDTAPPYTVSWNTNSIANGSHVITAVARDAVGKTKTSGSVTVTVQNSTSDATSPTAPKITAANVISSSQINLSWAASTDNVGVAGYTVFRDGVKIATVTGTTYSDTGLAPSTIYTYNVSAYDAAGNNSSKSAVKSATTLAVSGTNQKLTFYPAADASISQKNPTVNFGTTTIVKVDGTPVEESLIKFVVSGIGAAQVVDAKLRLYNTNQSVFGGSFYKVGNSWDEATVNWNNAPTGTTLLSSLSNVLYGVWYQVDLTSLITGDGTYSIRMKSSNSDAAYYSSKEGSKKPELVITIPK